MRKQEVKSVKGYVTNKKNEEEKEVKLSKLFSTNPKKLIFSFSYCSLCL